MQKRIAQSGLPASGAPDDTPNQGRSLDGDVAYTALG
jgi:hypothetical protein